MATGMVTYLRSLGGTFGVSIGSAAINNRLALTLPAVLQPAQTAAVMGSAIYIRESLPAAVQPEVIHLYVLAVRWIWFIMTGFAGLSFLCVLFIKHYSLRRDLKARDVEEAFVFNEIPSRRTSRHVQWPNMVSERIEVDSRIFTIKKKVLVEKRLWDDGTSEEDRDDVIVVLFATEDLA